jgi:ABC-type multidrug transport system fused ATPase/permease subunit
MRLPFRKKTKRECAQAAQDARRKEKASRFKRSKARRHWAYFLSYLGHYKKNIAWLSILIVVGGFLEIVLPQLVRFVIDVIVPARDFSLLNIIIVAGFALYLLHAFVRYREQKQIVSLSLNLITEVRRDLFDYHLSLPLSFFERQSSGRLISKLTYSASMLKLLVETFAYVTMKELVTIALIVTAASFIDLKLTLIFLLLTPLLAIYIHRLNRYMMEIARHLQTKNDQIMTVLNQTYNAIKLHHVFGSAPKEVARLEKIMNEDKAFRIRRTMVYAGNVILIGLVTSCVILSALWYGGRQMIMGELSSGDLTAYVIYLAMLLRPVSEFVRASAYLQAGRVAVYSVFSVFDRASPLPEPEEPKVPERMEGSVAFEKVAYRYASGRVGVDHLSFDVKPGQRVLIMGPSGSGKSTVFNLMMRLYDCEGGRVLLDGIDVRKMRRSDLLAYFSVIPQDQLHIEDTLLSNILIDGMEDSPGAKLDLALELTQKIRMDAKVMMRHNKFGERVGGEGIGLSRGELQKIALLRAAAKGAPIVLMDEPTSSMDVRSRSQALEFARELFAGKTVFMISHQVEPDFQADWIVVLRNGRMENQGTHHYLLEHSSFYRQAFRSSGMREGNASGT